jgi:hypothetical protein
VDIKKQTGMNTTDQQKLIRAGYILIRPDDQPNPRIKIKDSQSFEWRTLEKFDSKAARDRKLKWLLTAEKTIQD